MIRASILVLLLICTLCSFCGVEFVSLGRHLWRCKQRLSQVPNGQANSFRLPQPVIRSPNSISNSGIVKCCCGKNCKGIRGLKMHQRSCRVVLGLNDDLRADIDEQQLNTTFTATSETTESVINNLVQDNSSPDLNRGINLPKSDEEWSTANAFFKSALYSDPPIRSQDINSNIKLLNDVIYK